MNVMLCYAMLSYGHGKSILLESGLVRLSLFRADVAILVAQRVRDLRAYRLASGV